MVPDTPLNDPIRTAEVLFFTRNGTPLPSTLGKVSPEQLAGLVPSAVALEATRQAFAARGFKVQVGNFGLTIAGTTSLFEQTFQVTIAETYEPLELPVPEDLEDSVESIILNAAFELY